MGSPSGAKRTTLISTPGSTPISSRRCCSAGSPATSSTVPDAPTGSLSSVWLDIAISGYRPHVHAGEQFTGQCETRIADAEDGGVALANDSDALARADTEFTHAFDAAFGIEQFHDFEDAVLWGEGGKRSCGLLSL